MQTTFCTAVLLAACTPPRVSPPPALPVPDTLVREVPRPVERTFPSRVPRAANAYDLTWSVLSTDSAGSRRDSSQSAVLLTLVGEDAASSPVRFHPIATRLQTDSARTDTLTVFEVRQDGAAFRTDGTTCDRAGRVDVSPLLLRHVVVRSASRWPVSDTLNYSTCVSGIPVTVSANVTWDAPQLQDTLFLQDVRITGRLRSDSTRKLPMRMDGEIASRAVLRIHASGVVQQAEGQTTLHLVAQANTIRQVVNQVLAFRGSLRLGPQ